MKSNLFKIIVIRHCVVALPKYVEAILVTSATMMIFTVLVYAKEERQPRVYELRVF